MTSPPLTPFLAEIPAAPGAYVLLIALPAPRRHGIARLSPALLPAGRYAYCGSARGPGGLRARIGRHLRPGKQLHWHVDRLTAVGRVDALGWTQEAGECDLVAAWSAAPGVSLPLPGFGSSDCRRCPAHLLRLGDLGAQSPALIPLELRTHLHWIAVAAQSGLSAKGHNEITA